MKLYHCPGSRSIRIVWLLEELGLNYDLHSMPLGSPEMRTPEYLAIHPGGRVPALGDGDVTLGESGAIVEYLLARHSDGQMRPDPSAPAFPKYLQWLHFPEGMLMPQINVIVVETKFLPPEKRSDVHAARALKLLNKMLGIVEQGLSDGREWLTGSFSGADIMTGHACWVSARFGGDVSDKPNVAAYVDRVAARPAFQRASVA